MFMKVLAKVFNYRPNIMRILPCGKHFDNYTVSPDVICPFILINLMRDKSSVIISYIK